MSDDVVQIGRYEDGSSTEMRVRDHILTYSCEEMHDLFGTACILRLCGTVECRTEMKQNDCRCGTNRDDDLPLLVSIVRES